MPYKKLFFLVLVVLNGIKQDSDQQLPMSPEITAFLFSVWFHTFRLQSAFFFAYDEALILLTLHNFHVQIFNFCVVSLQLSLQRILATARLF